MKLTNQNPDFVNIQYENGAHYRLNMSKRIREESADKGAFKVHLAQCSINGKRPGIDIVKYNDPNSKVKLFQKTHHQFFNVLKIKSNL